jgi:hypothetical protein
MASISAATRVESAGGKRMAAAEVIVPMLLHLKLRRRAGLILDIGIMVGS